MAFMRRWLGKIPFRFICYTPLLDFARETGSLPHGGRVYAHGESPSKRKEPDYERFYEVWLPVRPTHALSAF